MWCLIFKSDYFTVAIVFFPVTARDLVACDLEREIYLRQDKRMLHDEYNLLLKKTTKARGRKKPRVSVK